MPTKEVMVSLGSYRNSYVICLPGERAKCKALLVRLGGKILGAVFSSCAKRQPPDFNKTVADFISHVVINLSYGAS